MNRKTITGTIRLAKNTTPGIWRKLSGSNFFFIKSGPGSKITHRSDIPNNETLYGLIFVPDNEIFDSKPINLKPVPEFNKLFSKAWDDVITCEVIEDDYTNYTYVPLESILLDGYPIRQHQNKILVNESVGAGLSRMRTEAIQQTRQSVGEVSDITIKIMDIDHVMKNINIDPDKKYKTLLKIMWPDVFDVMSFAEQNMSLMQLAEKDWKELKIKLLLAIRDSVKQPIKTA